MSRVVHVASAREWRGGQRQVWLLARELGQMGVEQIVITGAGTELARRLSRDRVPVRPVIWRAGLDPRVLPAVLGEIRGQESLLHAHDAHALTLAGLCGALTGVPLVATRRVDFRLRRRGFWGRAERIIAISNAVAEVLARDGIARDRITVVHSGLNLEETRRAYPLGIRAQLALPADALIASNVAALVPHKDHDTLLDAAKRLELHRPDLHWVVAGEGELRVALERRIVALGLGKRVHLMGHMDEPARLIADSNVFVMSSQEEGLGTSVLEAMALGIPVASTAAGGLPELLANGAGLLVSTRDSGALADAVMRVVEDPALGRALAERAAVEVLRFTDQRMAEAVGRVYRSCFHTLDGS